MSAPPIPPSLLEPILPAPPPKTPPTPAYTTRRRIIVVYGGNGALGAKCIARLKANEFWIICIDYSRNPEANLNICPKRDEPIPKQEFYVLKTLGNKLNGCRIEAVICVAGGFAGGNIKENLTKKADLMWKKIVGSSLITAKIATNFLKDTGGLVILTGAKVARESTPSMIGFGIAKAAVHQLTKSLAAKGSGLPENAVVISILPLILDTPRNRVEIPKADFTNWTPLEYVAELFVRWLNGKDTPKSGSFIELMKASDISSTTNLHESKSKNNLFSTSEDAILQELMFANKKSCTFMNGGDPSSRCLKCNIFRSLWKLSVNFYDILGLLDICPCSTIHSVKPYISYKVMH